jgi:hypothetical protein
MTDLLTTIAPLDDDAPTAVPRLIAKLRSLLQELEADAT